MISSSVATSPFFTIESSAFLSKLYRSKFLLKHKQKINSYSITFQESVMNHTLLGYINKVKVHLVE